MSDREERGDPLTYKATVIDPPNITKKLAGATVELLKRSDRSVITSAISDEGATVLYNRNSPISFDTSLTATGSIGLATAFNVPAGPTKVTVTYQGSSTTLETNTVANEIHLIEINP